ncbi:MAG: hypothetical protein QN720_10365 [Nitrososphaeraceae archaeon]|nr:hypothetical protein [Nitrososphaeraceae archaeon]MDW0333347.1 hypothetical protein [Nitrososphaeraceae archaeon]
MCKTVRDILQIAGYDVAELEQLIANKVTATQQSLQAAWLDILVVISNLRLLLNQLTNLLRTK